MRPYDGRNAVALEDTTANVRVLIPNSDFDGNGQNFYLRYIIVRNTGVAGVLELFDQDDSGAGVAGNKVFEFDIPANATTVIEIPAPGVSFKTNISAGLTAAAGTVAAAAVRAGGYLKGGM